MRPRKNIFIFCANDNLRSELAFLLALRGYAVMGAISQYPPLPDAALIIHDFTGSAGVASALPLHLPTLVLIPKLSREPEIYGYPAHAQFLAIKMPHIELLERLRIAVARKRGPKKGTKQEPKPVPMATWAVVTA